MIESTLESLRLMVFATFTGVAIYQLLTVFDSRFQEAEIKTETKLRRQ